MNFSRINVKRKKIRLFATSSMRQYSAHPCSYLYEVVAEEVVGVSEEDVTIRMARYPGGKLEIAGVRRLVVYLINQLSGP